jgi:hypothetical protein
MLTIKIIPTLLLAASLGAGATLTSQAAFARNSGQHEQHNNGQGGGKQNGNAASTAREAKASGNRYKKQKGNGGGFVVTHGGNPPRGDQSGGFVVTHGGNPPRGPSPTMKPAAPGKTTTQVEN